jgi:DNA-binding transcriptional MocR family regulator
MKLYQRLADDISTLIRDGAMRLGERIPSVREISRERSLSTATVVRAYEVYKAARTGEAAHLPPLRTIGTKFKLKGLHPFHDPMIRLVYE